jgi:hypothetical protein
MRLQHARITQKYSCHISIFQVAGLQRILILFYTFIVSHMRAMCLTETYIFQFSNIYEEKESVWTWQSQFIRK